MGVTTLRRHKKRIKSTLNDITPVEEKVVVEEKKKSKRKKA